MTVIFDTSVADNKTCKTADFTKGYYYNITNCFI